MKSKHCLGIHYTNKALTAVVMEKTGPAPARFLAEFELNRPPEPTGADAVEQSLSALAADIRQRWVNLPPVILSLGGRFYQTLLHNSEFTLPQQIIKTLKYDIEEDFSLDAEATTLCFQIIPSAETGSRLMVHTAAREQLEPLLHHFEKAGLDPLCAQPDLDTWLTYLRQPGLLPAGKPVVTLALDDSILHLLLLNEQHQPLIGRTILCEDPNYLETTLIGEMKRTLALLPSDQHPQEVYYHTENLPAALLDNVCRPLALTCLPLPDPTAAKAMAHGAALGWLQQSPAADFREDHLPPQSLIKIHQKALTGLAGAVSILLLVLIVIFHAYSASYSRLTLQKQKDIQDLWTKVNPGQPPPKKLSTIQQMLRRTSQKLAESNNAANTLEDSAGNTFRLVLTSLSDPNHLRDPNLLKELDLQTDSLRMSGNTAYLSGSVSNLSQIVTLFKLFETDKSQLEIGKWETKQSISNQSSSGRYTFTMPLRVKTSPTPEEVKHAR